MYFYQHHIGDYRRDTSHLSLLEHGIYRQLLDLYYITEKPLDANALRLISARTQDEKDATQQILNEFFTLKDGLYYHNRCDAEINRFKSKSDKAKASADARWNKNKDLENANASETQSERNANHKPLTINHEPLTKTNKNSDEFLEFWKKYPKKVGKDKALQAWNKKKPPLIEILKALQWQCISDQWKKGYIPNPATYLNDGRWQDEQFVNSREADRQWFVGGSDAPAIEMQEIVIGANND